MNPDSRRPVPRFTATSSNPTRAYGLIVALAASLVLRLRSHRSGMSRWVANEKRLKKRLYYIDSTTARLHALRRSDFRHAQHTRRSQSASSRLDARAIAEHERDHLRNHRRERT